MNFQIIIVFLKLIGKNKSHVGWGLLAKIITIQTNLEFPNIF